MTAYDAAGNRGATTQYEFWVKATAPYGQVDVAGVGLPSKITLSSTLPRVTEFSYQLPGGPEVRFPATDGTGSASITFTAAGYYEITIRTYAGTKMVGATTLPTSVSDAPTVESTEFTLDRDAVVGATGQFHVPAALVRRGVLCVRLRPRRRAAGGRGGRRRHRDHRVDRRDPQLLPAERAVRAGRRRAVGRHVLPVLRHRQQAERVRPGPGQLPPYRWGRPAARYPVPELPTGPDRLRVPLQRRPRTDGRDQRLRLRDGHARPRR